MLAVQADKVVTFNFTLVCTSFYAVIACLMRDSILADLSILKLVLGSAIKKIVVKLL